MKLKRIMAIVLCFAMVLSTMSFNVFAEEPDTSGDIINVDASNAQDVLDGKYGSINGKTINFTEDITEVLDLARPTKYEGSETTYYKYDISIPGPEATATEWSEDISSVMNSHSHYYRTLSDVTFTADDGVSVAGFTFSAGHVASAGYDYVRDVELTSGETYYKHSSMDNITFSGLTVTGHFDAMLYLEGCTVENVAFDGCTFTGTTDDESNAAIKFLADSQYFTNVTVENCSIDGYFQGVYISGVDGASIADNNISNIVHNAIALQSSENPVLGSVVVEENFISNVTDRAIRMNHVGDADITINNNVMVDCGDDEGQLIKATSVADEATVDLEANYWNGAAVSTAVSGLTAPTTVGVTGGTWDIDIADYVADGYEFDEDGNVVESTPAETTVAKIGENEYATLAEAIAEATESDTIELIADASVESTALDGVNLTIADGVALTINGGSLTGVSIDGAGTTYFGDNINFYGDNKVISGINGSDFELIVNKGATLLISRFVLGYNRNITVYGEIEDAHTFDPTGKTPSLKFNSTSGVSVGGTGTGNITAKDAYLEFGNSSWKNSQATHTWSFDNCYVSATSFGNNNAPAVDSANWTVTFDDSVLAAKNYIKTGPNVTYNFTNGTVATTGSLRNDGVINIDETSSVTTTSQQNNTVGAVDEHGGNNGTVNVSGTLTIGSNAKTQFEMLGGTLNVDGGSVNLGSNSLTLDATSKLESDGNINGAIIANDGATVEISGGTYTQDVTDWCANGFACEDKGDGTFGIVKAPALVTTLEELKNALADGGEINVAADITVDEALTIPEGVTVTVAAEKTLRVLDTITNNGTINGDGKVSVDVMVYVVETVTPYEGVSYDVTATKNGALTDTAPECTVVYEISLDSGNNWFVDSTNGKAQAVTVKTDGTKSVSTSFQSAFTSAKTGETVHMLKDAHVQSTNTKKNNGPLRSYYGLILEGNGHTIYTDLESSGASNEYATIKFTSYLAGTGPEVNPVLKNVTIDSQKNAKADLDFVSGDVTFTVTMYNVNLLGNCQYANFATVSPALVINKSEIEVFDCVIPKWDAGSAKAIDLYSGNFSLTLNNKCTVYGGTYTKDVSAYLADGLLIQDNGDGTYGVKPDPAYGKVAKIGDNYFENLADALTTAQDGETITLLWEDGDDPIAMNGAVYGKSVTITGTATVDWSKGFLFVGRGGAGNGTLTFDNANLTAASNQASTGIHVSGREKDTDNKYDGTLIINNSTIELDYLINKGTITLDNSTLTVKNGFAVGGRPASETESGEDATATMTLNNNSKVVVNNHNGMGIGYEAIGIVNVNDGSTFEATQSFLVAPKGTLNINDGTFIAAGSLTTNKNVFISGDSVVKINDLQGRVTAMDDTTLTASYVKSSTNGTIRVLGDITLNDGFDAAYFMTSGTTTSTSGYANTVTIEDGTTLNVSYGVEFNGDVTLNGGTIKLSGGNANGELWGFVFQSGTPTINSDIVVVGNTGTYAPVHFTNVTATVNGSISHSNSGGCPIYIGTTNTPSTVTFADDAVITTEVGVYVYAGTLKSTGDVNSKITKADGTAIEISGGTYKQDVSAWCVNGYVCKDNGDSTYSVVSIKPDAYTVTVKASEEEVRYNNGNPDTFTVEYVVTGGNVIGAMAQYNYDNTLFTCAEDVDNDGKLILYNNDLTTAANGETVIAKLTFTVNKDVEVDTTYKFLAEKVQVTSDYDAAGSGAQDGFVENVVGDEVTVVAQWKVTLPDNNSLTGNTYVDKNTDYSATINNFDENMTYTIKYTMGNGEEQTIEVTKENAVDNGFIIEDVTGDIVFTDVSYELNCEIVLVPDYVNGCTLVIVKDGVANGYTYDNAPMYPVARYEGITELPATANSYIVGNILNATSVRAILIEGAVNEAQARALIKAADSEPDDIEKSFDVNGNGSLFFNDAMTAHGCYKEQYDLALELAYYLRADVDTDLKIRTLDYDATVGAILDELYGN